MNAPYSVDPRQDSRWDAFVHAHPDASVYHLSAWSEILAKAYRFKCAYLAVDGGAGEMLGVMPLMRRRGPVTGHRMRSLPAVEIGGPLSLAQEADVELVRAACDEARKCAANLLIDSPRTLGVAVSELVEIPRPPTWVSELPASMDSYDDWLKARSRNLRRGVRRAADRFIQVRPAESLDDLRRFYRLYVSTMRKHHALPRPWQQLALARELLGGSVFRLFLAEQRGSLVAGGVFHQFHGTLELLYNGSDRSALADRPNHALYAGVVRWAIEHGLEAIDYGFAWPDSTLAAFKRQWGAEEVPRYRWGLGISPRSGQRGSGGAGRFHSVVDRAWGSLPSPLLKAGATVAYRYL